MPYYCTVPRCTSMAGKAKNVSFHQFPRDAELAKLWNNILKRGKPYTKYSKVCSLHFKPEDYTITSAGKNKGQWRTLRKDAIPSQNLPSDTPVPYQRRQSGAWVPSLPVVGDQLHQQAQHIARAIYMQTMLAMQAAGVTEPIGLNPMCNGIPPPPSEDPSPIPTTSPESPDPETSADEEPQSQESHRHSQQTDRGNTSYKCDDCSRCFKDPDVFLLHKRTHKTTETGKENYNLNALKPELKETLRSNPILANLLKNTMEKNIFNSNFIEKQLLVSFSNVESYLRSVNDDFNVCDNSELSESIESDKLVIDESVA